MIGLMPSPSRYRKARLSYIGTTLDTSDLTTYTLAGVGIGTPAPDRLVVAVVMGRAGAGRTISSVTIGGVTATAAITSGSQNNPTGIYYALVPSGTTATVVATFSGGLVRMAVAIYSLTGYRNMVPAATGQDYNSTTTLSTTLNRPADAVVVAGALTSSNGTFTWTGPTEDADAAIEGGTDRVSSASAAFSAADAAMPVSFVNTSSGAVSLAAACWT